MATRTTTKVKLAVQGMVCSACERHVREALEEAPGVTRAAVSVSDGLATVEYDPSRVAPAYLIAMVTEAGYGAYVAEQCDPAVDPCASCASVATN